MDIPALTAFAERWWRRDTCVGGAAAPALLKGFLGRLMAPGFAFKTCEGGIGYQGLLQGRSAQLITTMDTPPLVHRLQQARITRMERLEHKAGAWLRSVRLQFYPMSWMAYAIGALAVSPRQLRARTPVFWVGYLCLFLLEVATVLVNEVFDLSTDQRNRYFNAARYSQGSPLPVFRRLAAPNRR